MDHRVWLRYIEILLEVLFRLNCCFKLKSRFHMQVCQTYRLLLVYLMDIEYGAEVRIEFKDL